MAKIKIGGLPKSEGTDPYDNVYDPYNNIYGGRAEGFLVNYSLNFALCSSPKDGRRQCTKFTNCKAYMHDSVYDFLSGSHLFYDRKSSPPIDMTKLRLLVGRGDGGEDFKKSLYAAKKVVNFYEEIAGWKPSKIAQVEHSNNYQDLYLIIGPRQWMSAPQLLSMITLILRACTMNGPVKFENNDDLEKLYKKWGTSQMAKDSHCIRDCWNKLFLVVRHYDELFDGFKPEDLYVNDHETVLSHSNGIQYLCKFISATPELNKRFKEICKENGVT